MAPIVHWMRDIIHTRASVYIPKETVLANTHNRPTTEYCLEMSGSSVDQVSIKSGSPTHDRSDNPSHSSSNWPMSINKSSFWPKMKRRFDHQRQVSDDIILPLQGRSPSSLSDTSVPAITALPPLYRGSSLLRRRKISVPELRQKPPPEHFEAPLIDSRMFLYCHTGSC
jgi:hypothetical protein